jgi:hypothetical protein
VPIGVGGCGLRTRADRIDGAIESLEIHLLGCRLLGVGVVVALGLDRPRGDRDEDAKKQDLKPANLHDASLFAVPYETCPVPGRFKKPNRLIIGPGVGQVKRRTG